MRGLSCFSGALFFAFFACVTILLNFGCRSHTGFIRMGDLNTDIERLELEVEHD